MQPSALSRLIKLEAQRLGFELVGITTPAPPPHFDVYKSWLVAGRHGEMAYLATDRALQRRSDPHLIMADCQSILILGARYPAPQKTLPSTSNLPQDASPGTSPRHGRIAAYAWGADYHQVLPELMRKLVEFIESQVGHQVPNRSYTDSGPLMERELAQRAGLGWIGKNTCLINPSGGSYYLLSEILLSLELEADAPFQADRCGSCTRCVNACPTGCILPNRTLDARRCISYLTIELKNAIPDALRRFLSNWIFGCDICQQVCPWNQRFSSADVLQAFSPRPVTYNPDLIAVLELSAATFNQIYKDSPVLRAKRRGYLRNAAIALGNLSRESIVESQATDLQGSLLEATIALERLLFAETEPLIRRHAAWALGQIASPRALHILSQSAEREKDLDVQVEIQTAQMRASKTS